MQEKVGGSFHISILNSAELSGLKGKIFLFSLSPNAILVPEELVRDLFSLSRQVTIVRPTQEKLGGPSKVVEASVVT